MIWFYLSLLSVFALAAAELTQQKLLNTKDGVSARTSAVLTVFFQSLFVLPIVMLSPLRDQLFSIFNPLLLPKLIAVVLVGAVGVVLYMQSFQVKNISISTIFVAFSAVVSTTLGIIFLGESIYPLKFLGILLVLTAIIALNFKNAFLEQKHFFGLLAGICFGVTYTLDKSITQFVPPLIYILWTFFFVSVVEFLMGPREVLKSLKGKPFLFFKPILLSSLGYGIYNFLTFTAYNFGGEVGRIDAINNSQVFLIILFEYFILRHTKGMKRKLITAAIAYTGVVTLGLF